MAYSFPEPSSAERQFRLLANNAPVLIWRAGPDKVCDWFNKPWLDFTGRTMEQELDNGWFEGVHPDDFERCFAIYVGAFDRREAFSLEYRLRRHDGIYCWLFDNGRPFFHEDGTFAGYFGSCIDITRQKTTEAELQAALSDRGTLLAEVNHRVKNNMQLVVGLVHLAARGAEPDLRPHLKRLSTRIQSVAYVQERLHHARRLSLIDLAGLLAELAPGLTGLAGDGHVTARVVGGGVAVALNQAMGLGLAIGEILSEATLHTDRAPEDGAVTIIVQHSGENGVVQVEGAGFGWPADTSVRTAGLSFRLLQGYAQQAGATLSQEPADRGASLRLTFPLPEAAPMTSASSSAARSG